MLTVNFVYLPRLGRLDAGVSNEMKH